MRRFLWKATFRMYKYIILFFLAIWAFSTVNSSAAEGDLTPMLILILVVMLMAVIRFFLFMRKRAKKRV
ncbi:hypothetical protein UP12_19370 (plasmid) [Bacillus pumilus]|nr:hypothetical protein UP12_19370 [Bacillus pumilus]